MSKAQIQAVRGMNDILPSQMPYWRLVETCLRTVTESYGYQEIRLPLVESTQLFERSIGEVTDIVEKEMYTFPDRNGDSLTLRPEGTAGCVRACLQNGLLHNQIQRLWYSGPMYRHERPQRGRYRQFFQFGVECYGIADAYADAELIAISARFWRALGLSSQLELQINSLGSLEARAIYREKLVEYFNQHHSHLDEDSIRRLTTNPLRILDSKNPEMQSLIQEAPNLQDYLDEASSQHFKKLLSILDSYGIAYTLNPRLVRGLDYYSQTVFEWVTTALGAQGTVCAGGRYDGLITQLGGSATSAIGFAVGIERVIDLVQSLEHLQVDLSKADIYMIAVGEAALAYAATLTEQLRTEFSRLRIIFNAEASSFKSQFKRADQSGARLALIIGEEEARAQQIGVKYLRESKDQENLEIPALSKKLHTIFQ